MNEIHPVAQVLHELQFLLGGLFGALLSYFAWTRQFRKQQRQSVVQETAKALGMYYEDATNPEVLEQKKQDLAAGKQARSVVMRRETSSALATQTLLVKAVFGDTQEEQLRKVTVFDPNDDPSGNKFVGKASTFLKSLMDRA